MLARYWIDCSLGRGSHSADSEEDVMRDFIFIVLTIAVFVVFALIARGAEKL
jgi:hypothetical protein